RRLRHTRDFAKEFLPRDVGRMGATGEYEQDRPLRIADDLPERFEIVEEQRRTLVRCKTAPETDRKHVGVVRIRVLQQTIEVRLASLVARMLDAYAPADELEHPHFQILVNGPENMVRHPI